MTGRVNATVILVAHPAQTDDKVTIGFETMKR